MLSISQNKQIVKEMRAEMIGLYKTLGDFIRNCDAANTGIYERKIEEMEKLLADRSHNVYDCTCTSDDDSDEAYEEYLRGKPFQCVGCLRKFVEREKRKYPLMLDKLNWGLSGVQQGPPSDESSGVTSSDEDEPRKSSSVKMKLLRKLRRQGPDKFQLKYFSTGVEEFLKMEIGEDELKSVLESESAKHLLAKRERCKKVVLPGTENFDDFAGGLYGLSGDTRLKAKLSADSFHFISNVVDELQRYLKEHPTEYYPNISELILSSAFNFYDHREALTHYYDVLYKRKANDAAKSNGHSAEGEAGKDKASYCSAYKETYPADTTDLPAREVSRARDTGILNLSSRTLRQVPALAWLLDKAPVEYQVPVKGKQKTSPLNANSKRPFQPLRCLDLSDNLLTNVTPEGSCLNSLNTLKLTGNQISKFPARLKGFKCLVELNLANNLMKKIPKALSRITTLKKLNVCNNDLESLTDEFGNLKHLVTLDLRWNKLKSLPESMGELVFLKVLNAGYNRLRRVPKNTGNMAGLIVLDISYNKISELARLTGLTRLVVFNASGNYITRFPDLSGCKRLCEVRLDGNRINSFSVKLMHDVPVVQLTLSYNKILQIPDDLFLLATLVLLDLTGNRLTWLPWSLARLKYLSCIKIELNPVQNLRTQDIKEGSKRIMEVLLRNLLYFESDKEAIVKAKWETEGPFVNMKSVDADATRAPNEQDTRSTQASYKNLNLFGKPAVPESWLQEFARRQVSSVDLSKNNLGWLPHQVTMLAPSLQQLFVRSNCFRLVPDFIDQLTNLTVLDLSENHLTALPATIAKCPLQKLLCRFNEFSQMPTVLFEIPTLTHLDLSYNNIKTVDIEGLKQLKDISTLNLHGNEITHVPSALGFLTSIKELDIGENVFKHPEKSVLDKGTTEIMAYLRKHDESGMVYKSSPEKHTVKRVKRVTIAEIPTIYK